jgi:hypothetical protein
MQGHAVHQFDDCQIRTFDLKDSNQDRCLSRYSLLKEFNEDGTYAGNLIPAANLTTRKVEVDIDVKGEALLELYYRNCGAYGAIGYNVWGKKCENVCDKGACNRNIKNSNVGIKGCAPVEATCFNVVDDGGNPVIDGPPLAPVGGALSSTQSDATAFSCGSVDSPQPASLNTIGNQFCANSCADLSAVTPGANPTSDALQLVQAQNSANADGTLNPSILGQDNINIVGNDSQVSHKIYGRYGYEFCDSDFSPYVEVGASGEFASSDRPNTLEQWGIFVRGGISF